MKKIILLSLVFTIQSLTSCRKDRLCTCSYSDGTVASEITYTNLTRKEAKNLCVSSSADINCSLN